MFITMHREDAAVALLLLKEITFAGRYNTGIDLSIEIANPTYAVSWLIDIVELF